MQKKLMEDAELLAFIRKDASKGMKYMMDCYSGLVYYVVEGKLKGYQQDIEECVVDVFWDFYDKLDTIDLNKGSIKGYLVTVATRKAIGRFRKLCRNKSDAMDEMEILDFGVSRSPEEFLIDSEKKEIIIQEINKLGEPDNDILFRRYFLSQPVKDIADYYEMKSNSVSKRITRALEVLRGRLEAYYYGH